MQRAQGLYTLEFEGRLTARSERKLLSLITIASEIPSLLAKLSTKSNFDFLAFGPLRALSVIMNFAEPTGFALAPLIVRTETFPQRLHLRIVPKFDECRTIVVAPDCLGKHIGTRDDLAVAHDDGSSIEE